MLNQHASWPFFPCLMRAEQGYEEWVTKDPAVFVSFILSFLSRRDAFAWSPSVDLSDNEVRSTLLPGAQY